MFHCMESLVTLRKRLLRVSKEVKLYHSIYECLESLLKIYCFFSEDSRPAKYAKYIKLDGKSFHVNSSFHFCYNVAVKKALVSMKKKFFYVYVRTHIKKLFSNGRLENLN